jgi:hypothetical protein
MGMVVMTGIDIVTSMVPAIRIGMMTVIDVGTGTATTAAMTTMI